MADLSAAQARRIALGALGFADPRPARAGIGHIRKMASRLNAIQIDSVNVLVRAHYMPAFSRLGPYPMERLDELAYDRREWFEFWGHAACWMPMTLYPLFRYRMDIHRNTDYSGRVSAQMKRYVEVVYRDVAERGPLAASEVVQAGKSSGNWWGWSDGKRAIEWLWRQGRIAIAGRRNFERLYDIAERVIPKDVLDAPAPGRDESRKRLLETAASALGVGTANDIAGYFHVDGWWERDPRTGKRAGSDIPRLLRELVEEGRLVPARVEGWSSDALMAPGAKVPRAVEARALVSPFDPLMWERRTTREGHRPRRMFGFDYTIEIYVPEPKRVHGYYVLPFLLGDELVARVDLKADRKDATLLVPGAFLEAGQDAKRVAAELADELRTMASWLSLERIRVGSRGNLARPLARAL